MHQQHPHHWQHSHTFDQDRKRPGESRTLTVIIITAVTMLVEVVSGWLFGSMALLADGLHMASHAAALTVTLFAYRYARLNASSSYYSFGTGKVNSLAGFASAILLLCFALIMAWESVLRLFNPVSIAYNQAILVAVLGLAVNALCVFILGGHHGNDHHEHEHEQHHKPEHHHDHNLKAAYFHVLADALTSILAIIALLVAKYQGWIAMDPLMGIIGAVLVTRWSIGLIKTTSAVLLDRQAPESVQQSVRESLEIEGDTLVDLHIWRIAPAKYSLIASLVSHHPHPPEHYKDRLPEHLDIAHITVEVHHHGQ